MKMIQKKHQFGVQFTSKNELNQHDLRILQNSIRGLLDLEVKKSLFNVTCFYSIVDEEPFITYLQKPITMDEFKIIIHKIINVMIEVEKNHLLVDSLLLDYQYIYVNRYSYEIEFAYLPNYSDHSKVQLKDFFLELVRHCHFLSGDDYQSVQEYIQMIQSKEVFHYYDLLTWINHETVVEETLEIEESTMPLLPVIEVFIKQVDCEEETKIDHFPFIIGSSNQCDLVIRNSVISRKHISIIQEGENYYITDLKSTNGTFYQNEKCIPETKVQINEGVFTLANIDFEFYIHKRDL